MTRICPDSEISPLTRRSYFSSGFALFPGLEVYQLRRHAPAKSVLALVNIEAIELNLQKENGTQLLMQFLSPRERKIFAAFSYPKRRREWLAGRIVCKYAVLRLMNEPVSLHCFPTFSVLPGENAAPVLSFSAANQAVPSVSITHSGCYAAAMAIRVDSCGIDIQQVTGKIKNVVSRFARPRELRLLEEDTANMGEEERLTLLWSAKEAVKKSILRDQPVIFKGMDLQRVSTDRATSMRLRTSGNGAKTAEVTALLLDRYALAYTVAGGQHA